MTLETRHQSMKVGHAIYCKENVLRRNALTISLFYFLYSLASPSQKIIIKYTQGSSEVTVLPICLLSFSLIGLVFQNSSINIKYLLFLKGLQKNYAIPEISSARSLNNCFQPYFFLTAS